MSQVCLSIILLLCFINPFSKVAATSLKPGDVVRRTLENAQVSRSVHDLLVSMVDVGDATNLMQRSSTHIGMAVSIWKELLERLPIRSPMASFVQHRAQDALASPVFCAANLLDPRFCTFFSLNSQTFFSPRFRGIDLNEDQVIMAKDLIAEVGGPKCAIQLAAYMAKMGPFGGLGTFRHCERMDPSIWWRGGNFPIEIANLAEQLMNCAASSADVERVFSTLGDVLSRKRNNLSVKTAAKAAFLARALNPGNASDSESIPIWAPPPLSGRSHPFVSQFVNSPLPLTFLFLNFL